MKSVASVLLAAALFAGCQNESSSNTAALEARLKKLEETNAKHAEALDFLEKVYGQQKQQNQQQEREEPADDAVFAVDISNDIANHQVEGPNSATVTIVEAWDFA